ncbi:MAG TPA: hypothetical protein VGM50_16765 [Gemmatimonadaceae bacterium]
MEQTDVSAVAKSAAMTVGVVIVVGAVLALVLRGPGDGWAIGLSGVVAIAVQLAAFHLGRMVGKDNLTGRMGIGALLRFFSLVLYAVVAVAVLKLPMVAALLSLFLFFFLSTLIEPFLIK